MAMILIGTLSDSTTFEVWAEDTAYGVTFTIKVVEGDGDIRGFFCDLNPYEAVTVTGEDVVLPVLNGDESVTDLGNGANVNGTHEEFDLGVEFGTAGIGEEKITETTFTVSGIDFDQLDGATFAIRSTSVGEDNEDSLKLVGQFDIPETFSISGTKYEDMNGDGNTDGDGGLGGVTIFVDEDGGGDYDEGELSTTTLADGSWTLTGLDASYDGMGVYEILQSGYVQTLGAAGYTIDGTSGNDQADMDFANFKLYEISGTKYEDMNGDGQTVGDDGLAGVTIFIDADDDGAFDDGEKYDVTDANGDWSITGLDWTYDGMKVKEVLSDGWVQTAGGGTVGGTSGNDQTDIDFANFELYDISGVKYTDLTGDGFSNEDTGLGGVTIFVDMDDSDDLSEGDLTATTADDGSWSITGLDWTAAGKDVLEVLSDGWVQTAGGGTVGGTSGNDQTDIDFANFELYDISGVKYTDLTGDGFSNEDTGLGGVTIFVDMDDSDDLSEGDLTATTADDGSWSITGLDWTAAGKDVLEVLSDGWVQTAGGGTVGGTSGNGQTDIDFANFELYDISGVKYKDITGDGITGEDTGLGGVTIYIDVDGSGTQTVGDMSTVTAVDGSWAFTNLDYSYAGKMVYEVVPNNYVQTVGEDGYEITGTSGADQTGFDFANLELPGPGVRTPGFWGSPNGLQFWDGRDGNETKAGQDGFADGELTYAVDSNHDGQIDGSDVKGLLIGDYNDDGLGVGEDVFFVSLADALKVINASTKDSQDVRFVLGRDAIATWLNHLAGNPLTSPLDSPTAQDPQWYLDEAIDWLQKTNGGHDEGWEDWGGAPKVGASTAPWQVGYPSTLGGGVDSEDGIMGGNQIHATLDGYNNTGDVNGFHYAVNSHII